MPRREPPTRSPLRRAREGVAWRDVSVSRASASAASCLLRLGFVPVSCQRHSVVLYIVMAVSSAGCLRSKLVQQYVGALPDCRADQVSVEDQGNGYRLSGCGHSATVLCRSVRLQDCSVDLDDAWYRETIRLGQMRQRDAARCSNAAGRGESEDSARKRSIRASIKNHVEFGWRACFLRTFAEGALQVSSFGMRLGFTIEPDGHVSCVSLAGRSPFSGLNDCVAGVVAAARFEPSHGDETLVSFPVSFVNAY